MSKQEDLPGKIAKLPPWAQGHIKALERERETAIRALNEYCDTQTPAPFYCDEYESTGEDRGPTSKRRYFQGHRITAAYGGVVLDVYLRPQGEIELSWEGEGQRSDDIAMIPVSFQRVRLVAHKNMRVWKKKD